MNRRRVAIVGAGIGARHLDGWLAHAERFEVVTVCDLDETRATPLVARARGAGMATRFESSLARTVAGEVDIVDICLPPRLHRDAIVRALEAGRHVVCEKPLVASLAELDEVAAAAAASGRLVMPVFQYRFGTGFGALCRLVDTGLAGTPFVATLETHWDRQADYYAVERHGKWATELGGAIVGHAIHVHDLLFRVLGPIARVQARLATRVNPIEVEDCAAILFEMANGALVTSSVTLGGAGNRSRLRFCFARLSAESGRDPYNPAAAPWQFVARGPAETLLEAQAAINREVASAPEHPDGYTRQFELFGEALEGRGPLPVTLDDARASLELVTAIYAADESGASVPLPLARAAPGYDGWGASRSTPS